LNILKSIIYLSRKFEIFNEPIAAALAYGIWKDLNLYNKIL